MSEAAAPAANAAPSPRLDRIGVLVVLAVLGALALPFVTFRANRIVPGHGLGVLAAFPGTLAALAVAGWLAAAALALLPGRPLRRALAGALALAWLGYWLGAAPARLVDADSAAIARISPAAGAWLLLFAFAVLIADALARLGLSPARRVLALVVALAAVGAALASGIWDGLSVMQEYAVRADTFWTEALRHLELVAGSTFAAFAVALPLGIGCAHRPAWRATLMPVLNVVQTIPSIALFGILMVPLGLLAAHLPLAAALGISGIGPAPALVALFLYALLPIVSSVVVGIDRVDPGVVEAAAAMGMTRRQRVLDIELALALPVILAGLRIVLVQNVGLAAVAALIGGGGFGTFIFQGLGQAATDLVLLGALPTIALAFVISVLFDAAIQLTQLTQRNPA
ncbi:ABC transporter permease [Burkholderia gladioli]|uniref:ABC transporter permease n=1 Tax=Burkholderia gladioli TaxID=28095 RepID=A0AB38TXQ2_BURGA|nr:ABC transporter permease [Burkholderia gladioli]UWX71854.1 ABC transporter permease [Burkholderia gladioli]